MVKMSGLLKLSSKPFYAYLYGFGLDRWVAFVSCFSFSIQLLIVIGWISGYRGFHQESNLHNNSRRGCTSVQLRDLPGQRSILPHARVCSSVQWSQNRDNNHNQPLPPSAASVSLFHLSSCSSCPTLPTSRYQIQ